MSDLEAPKEPCFTVECKGINDHGYHCHSIECCLRVIGPDIGDQREDWSLDKITVEDDGLGNSWRIDAHAVDQEYELEELRKEDDGRDSDDDYYLDAATRIPIWSVGLRWLSSETRANVVVKVHSEVNDEIGEQYESDPTELSFQAADSFQQESYQGADGVPFGLQSFKPVALMILSISPG